MSRSPQLDSKAISMRDALYIGMLMISMGVTYGIISNRLSTVESSIAQVNQRYDREVVPRSEHLQMNAVMEQRLLAIIQTQKEDSEQIKQIQLKLDQIAIRQGR